MGKCWVSSKCKNRAINQLRNGCPRQGGPTKISGGGVGVLRQQPAFCFTAPAATLLHRRLKGPRSPHTRDCDKYRISLRVPRIYFPFENLEKFFFQRGFKEEKGSIFGKEIKHLYLRKCANFFKEIQSTSYN